jgi:hypothetical protein
MARCVVDSAIAHERAFFVDPYGCVAAVASSIDDGSLLLRAVAAVPSRIYLTSTPEGYQGGNPKQNAMGQTTKLTIHHAIPMMFRRPPVVEPGDTLKSLP